MMQPCCLQEADEAKVAALAAQCTMLLEKLRLVEVQLQARAPPSAPSLTI